MQSVTHTLSKTAADALFEPQPSLLRAPAIAIQPSRVYTAEEIAPIFKVSKQWLLRHTRKTVAGGMIVPHLRIGKMIRFRVDEVQRYFDKHSVQ